MSEPRRGQAAPEGLRVIDGGAAPAEHPVRAPRGIELDAEASILSPILAMGREHLDVVREFLRPEHFYSESHRRIYEAACAVRDLPDSSLDIVTIATWLRTNDRLSQAGGMAYMTTVLNFAQTADPKAVKTWGKIVKEAWVLRQSGLVGAKLVAARESRQSVDEILRGTREAIDNLSNELGQTEKSAEIKAVLFRTVEAIQNVRATDGRGDLPTGFDRVDRMTVGLHTELRVIAGRPGMGKTSLLQQEGVNVASVRNDAGETPNGVALFSLETTEITFTQRLLCQQARMPVPKMRAGGMTKHDWDAVNAAAQRLSTLPIWLFDKPAVTVQEIWATCRRVDSMCRARGGRLRYVGIDYLQLARGAKAKHEQSREQIVSQNTRMLLAMANDLDCNVTALSQLNRSVEHRQDKRPMLSDLREAGEIEQCARTVAFLYRDEYYNRESADRGVVEVDIAKQNNGPTGVVRLGFDAMHTLFFNLREGDEWDRADGPAGDSLPPDVQARFDEQDNASASSAPPPAPAPPTPKPKVKSDARLGPLESTVVGMIVDALGPDGLTVSGLKRKLGEKGMDVDTVLAGVEAAVTAEKVVLDASGVVRRILP